MTVCMAVGPVARMLQDRLTFSKRRDLFVEIGAGNGEREASRTPMLEHARSWQGLLIEPDPVA